VTALRRLMDRVRTLLGNRGSDSEFEAEMDYHLNLQIDRLVAQGMTPEAARSAARRGFGNVTLLREERREMQAVSVLDAIRRDVRYTSRSLRMNPAFATAVVLTLGVVIVGKTDFLSVF
jgi:hypothetical protein